jgi:hypothetical protein
MPAVDATFKIRPEPRARIPGTYARELGERQDVERNLVAYAFFRDLLEAAVRREAGVVDQDAALRDAREYGRRSAGFA